MNQIDFPESQTDGESTRHEVEALQAYGLRWSVLAAWKDALVLRRVPLPDHPEVALERARIKLASGCFSACDVACDLSAVEASLTTADSSTDHNWVEFWLDLLGHAMGESAAAEQVLRIPAVRFRYQNCGIAGCACAG